MSFTPYNVYEDVLVRNEEERTLELEIEKGYKVFQDALACQKNNEFEQAKSYYDELLTYTVMNLEADVSPPSADKLKYLVAKNHAILLLNMLEQDIQEKDEEELQKSIQDIFDEFSEAFEYDDREPAFLQLVAEVCLQLGYKRESRLALEQVVYSDERDLLCEMKSGEIVNLQDMKGLIGLRNLLQKIGDSVTLKHNELMKQVEGLELDPRFWKPSRDFSWLTKHIDLGDSLERYLQINSNLELDITITSKDWESILNAITDKVGTLPKSKRKFQFEDPYTFSDEPAGVVNFQLPHGVAEAMEEEEHEEEEEGAGKKRRRKSDYDEARSRSSKRVRSMNQPLGTSSSPQEEDDLFEKINKFLEMAGTKMDSVLAVFDDEAEYKQQDQSLVDFRAQLQSWDDNQVDVFYRSASKKKKVRRDKDKEKDKDSDLESVMQMLDFAALGDTEMIRPQFKGACRGVERFLQQMRDGKLHVQETRIKILENLLATVDGKCLFIHDYWPDSLIKLVCKTAEHCEPLIFDRCKKSNGQCVKLLEIAQGICEMFGDCFLTNQKIIRASEKSSRELKEVEVRLQWYKTKFDWWLTLSGDMLQLSGGDQVELELRHEWMLILLSPDSLDELERLRGRIDKEMPGLDVEFRNCVNLARLSSESVQTQINKLQAASTFSKVFDKDEVDADTRIGILESILIPKRSNNGTATTSEEDALQQFFRTASLEFQLKIWYALLDAYDANGEAKKSFDGYLHIFNSRIEALNNHEYEAATDHERGVLLLRSLNICLDITRKLVKLSMDNSSLLEEMSPEVARQTMESSIQLTRIMRVFLLFHDGTGSNVIKKPQHLSWNKTVGLFNELVLRAWHLMYVSWKKCLPQSEIDENPIILNDLLANIHEEVGARDFCNIGDGFFLSMTMREIVEIDDEEVETDVLQCMYCRYGFAMGYDPYNHHTTPVNLTESTSLELIGFVMKVILSKKAITNYIRQVDVRAVLDEFFESLGTPDEKQLPVIVQNDSVLTRFLTDTVIDKTFLQDALNGRLTAGFFSCVNVVGKIGISGLYYIQGLTHLTQYKQRFKQNNANHDDVEDAIRYFSYDLICNTNRFETWFGLAECYDALATLDLMSGVDKISPEQRHVPRANQRKSIVACSMAISILLQSMQSNEDDSTRPLTAHYETQLKNLWPFFAKILYYSTRSPMSMEAYSMNQDKLFFNPDGQLYAKADKTIDHKTIYRVANEALKISLNNSTKEDWAVHYMRGKVLNRLDRHDEALQSFLQATKLVDKDPKNDALEPAYKLVSLAYKYLRAGLISAEQGISVLKESPFSSFVSSGSANRSINEGQPDTLEYEFYFICVSLLQRVKNDDKRRNHHRPNYRLAQIYDHVYGMVDKAKDEMTPYFTKGVSNTKPIIIWRNENERPGKHFEYMFQYVVYYTDLLERTKDSEQLGVLIRRMRRFNGPMVKRNVAWEKLCQATANVGKSVLGISANYAETMITQVSNDHFESCSTVMHEKLVSGVFKPDAGGHDWAKWMVYADDKKKLNNGYGSTSQIDDFFVSVYLSIYSEFLEKNPERKQPSAVPSPKPDQPAVANSEDASLVPHKQRVTRKAIMTKGRDLVRILGELETATATTTATATASRAITPEPTSVTNSATATPQ